MVGSTPARCRSAGIARQRRSSKGRHSSGGGVMGEASIPVDLFNPGQVFASLGFLEAADVLLGDAEGGFDWSNETDVHFLLRAAGDENPFTVVLNFLAKAEVYRCAPAGYTDPPSKRKPTVEDDEEESTARSRGLKFSE